MTENNDREQQFFADEINLVSGEQNEHILPELTDIYSDGDDDFAYGRLSDVPYYSGYGGTDEDTFEAYDYGDEKPLVYDSYDDDTPLTSDESDYHLDVGHEDADRPGRPSSRRETIARIAKEYAMQNEQKSARGSRKNSARRARQRSAISSEAEITKVSMEGILGNQKRRKSMFSAFYSVLALLGVGVCLTIMVVVAQNFLDNPPEIGGVPSPTPGIEGGPAVPIASLELRQKSVLVENTSIVGQTRRLTLMDVNTRLSREYTVLDTAIILSRVGSPMTFADIRIGHILDISYESRDMEIHNINESVQAWERRSRTNVMVDMNAATITIGNESWSFNSQTLVLYQGRTFPIAQIRPIDSVTVSGFGDTAWFVQLDAGHGFLRLTNTDMITNGTLMIGTHLFYALVDVTEPITLSEGTHRILVDGSNIEAFIRYADIEQGRTVTINLADVQFRLASLIVIVNPIDADVLINGEVHDVTEPAMLEFGEHVIRVESPGFYPQEETIEITSVNNLLQFELEEIVVDGQVRVHTTPPNAEVFIDQVFVGYSPITVTVQPGERHINVRLSGHSDMNYPIYVPPLEPGDRPIERHFWLLPAVHPDDVGPATPVVPLPTATPPPPPMPGDLQPPPPTQPGAGAPELPTLPVEENPFAPSN